jgi:acetate---CoA ligase (ADP-forming)
MIAEKTNENVALRALLEPESIAVIGASRNPNKVGHKILRNLLNSHYPGKIIPVNPSGENILGIEAFSSLAAYGKQVDQSIVVVPRASVKEAARASLEAGAKALTIISAGFKEQDSEGAELEKEVTALCREAGSRVLGPNCLGLLNTQYPMDASFGNKWPAAGNMAFISQSGALCSAILDRAVERGFGLSKMISIGNKSDVGENDLLTYLADDPDSAVIVAYLEGIDDGEAFMEAAEAASNQKPIVVFKSGITAAGSQAASSHTGSLAGADVAYEAAFRRCGISRVKTYEQMFEVAWGFANQPLPRGRRVALITNAGGVGIMAADAVEGSGLTMACLSQETKDRLQEVLPDAASVLNPVDVLGDAAPDRYAQAMDVVLADSGVDAIVVLLTPQAVTDPLGTAQELCRYMDGSKPVLACFLGGEDVNPARRYMIDNRLPDYRSPEKTVIVLKAMREYAEWRERPARKESTFETDRKTVQSIIADYRKRDEVQISEPDAKRILAAYGIPTPDGSLVTSAENAEQVAASLGFPLAMKIVSPDVIHKSDAGGVALNLNSATEVKQAYEAMVVRVKESVPNARIRGAYIERMCQPGGREVILGMNRDPQFGPLLMFGLGGIFVEVLKDVTFRIAPVTEKEATEMIREIRTHALLAGMRGESGVCIPALTSAIQRVGQLVTDFKEISELDINPFMAHPEEEHSLAADARITLKGCNVMQVG